MSGVTTGIDSLLNSVDSPYSVSSSIEDGAFGASTVNGEMSSNLFGQAAGDEMGKMDFLLLLTTQLQYQDPLEPMENTEFVSQLAQFSALEGNSNIEAAINDLGKDYKESLDILNYNALSTTNASAVSLIGKEVRLKQTSAFHTMGENTDVKVHVGEKSSVELQFLDAEGEVVKTMTTGAKDSENSAVVSWDGLKDDGTFASTGTYYLNVVGSDEDSALYCFEEDMVEGIRYTAEGPLVKIGGKEIPVANILDISKGDASKSSIDSGLSTSTAVSLIGKTVRYGSDDITYTPMSGGVVKVQADLGGYNSATVQVKDKDGKVVKTAQLDGTGYLELDATDHNGNGPYSVEVMEDYASIYSEGVVDGIVTKDGVVKLKIGTDEITLSDILDIKES